MTPSEKFVSKLCKQSFLPFWSFPNPIGKKGKELCDVFVVCENHVLIISVKDISVSEQSDELVQFERWAKKAIYESADQIYGAERFLDNVSEVYSKNGSFSIKLPNQEDRIYHRIAVAFGSPTTFPLPTGNFGKGFVHVLDEESTFILLNELDTITDFTNYLIAKEEFISNTTILIPSEPDFLALYIQAGLDLDVPADVIVSESGLWESYVRSKEYKQWRKEINVSYIWDRMILQLYDHHVNAEITDLRRMELEESVRKINLESRINRIELGKILENARKRKVRAQMIKPFPKSDHTYVFMPLSDKNWKAKASELKLRCVVARVENPAAPIVIGIAIGGNNNGLSVFDIFYLNLPELDESFKKKTMEIQQEFGYFRNPQVSHSKDLT